MTDIKIERGTKLIKVLAAQNRNERVDTDQIEKAEVPPEVLEYVAGTLKDKVHGKVDEAFDGGGDGQ